MTPAKVLLAASLAASLASCTALRVVTHEVNDDPVKAPAGLYRLDPRHSSLLFDVDHFGYSRFVARFDKVEATLDANTAEPEKSRLSVTVKAASVDTNVGELDSMVTGPDLLDAARYPDIRFETTALRRTGPKTGEMTGNLTMHGKTKPVTLEVTFNGASPDPLTGDDTLGFSARGAFNRADWGLSAWWPAVGNDVNVRIEAEFIKKHG
jgi:polyisoprenoid-binding protein YceI